MSHDDRSREHFSREHFNVVLTGFMGTGKTTVGRLLAERLGFEFVDTDRVIESRYGSIASIFADEGEDEFRRIEREVAAELAGRTGLVISTGGRMMIDAVNAEALGRNGRVFCLVASLDTIVERVTASRSPVERPLLRDAGDVRQRIADLLAERADAYARFASVDTDGHTPHEVCAAIVESLEGEPIGEPDH